MNEQEIFNLVKQLNNEKFLGLEDYQIGDAMYFVIQPIELHDKLNFSLFSFIKSVLNILFIRNVQKGKFFKKANKVFLFSNSYWGRNDHRIIYDKVFNTTVNSTEFIHAKKFTVANFTNIRQFNNWFNIFRKFFSGKKTRYYTCMLAKAYSDLNYIKKQLIKEKKDAVVTFCDIHLIDSLVTQFCNNNCIDTITMQHGNLPCGPSYGLSKSKFFLGYGEYTKKIAVLSGLNSKNFISIGMPQCIGKTFNENLILNKTKCIGVIFCNSETIDEDTKMLNIVLDYAENNNYKVLVKIHPACKKDNYLGINWNRVTAVYGKEVDIYKFSEYIDFATVGISTVFIEYIINLFPCMNYKCLKDKYADITWNKFSSVYELGEIINILKNNTKKFELKMKETRLYFTPVNNISKNYSDFFSKYDKNKGR